VISAVGRDKAALCIGNLKVFRVVAGQFEFLFKNRESTLAGPPIMLLIGAEAFCHRVVP